MKKITDAFNRTLKDLRISVTDRCNFRCRYCMPEELYGEGYQFLNRDDILSFEEIERLAKLFFKLGVNKIRLTGGEPLVRNNICELVEKLAKIDKSLDLAMTTNGYLLGNYAKHLFSSGLKRITVSLDSLNEEIFQEMSGKKFSVSRVLEGIKQAQDVGFKNVKINCVVKKKVNENSLLDLVDYCKENNLILRFIEYMDVGTLNDWDKSHVISSEEIVNKVSRYHQIEPITKNYPGEVSERFAFSDGKGEIGFVSSVTKPFCTSCTRARISTDGRLVTCLFASDGTNLKEMMRNGKSDNLILDKIESVWNIREDKYSLERSKIRKTNKTKIEMFQLGG